jgi:hypothetical protein
MFDYMAELKKAELAQAALTRRPLTGEEAARLQDPEDLNKVFDRRYSYAISADINENGVTYRRTIIRNVHDVHYALKYAASKVETATNINAYAEAF